MPTIPTRQVTIASRRPADVALRPSRRLSTPVEPRSDVAEDHAPARQDVFLRFRRPLLVVHALGCLDEILRLLQPLMLGLAINGLLNSSYRGLLIFSGGSLLSLIVSTARHMYGVRIFAAMHTRLAIDDAVNRSSPATIHPPSDDAGRGGREIEYFEQFLPAAMHTAFSLIGSLMLLGWYDAALVPLCLLLLLPAGLLNAAYGQKVTLLASRLNAPRDAAPDSGEIRDTRNVRSHFESLGRWRTRLADATGIRSALMELFVLGLLATTLVHYCVQGSTAGELVPAGNIVAVFAYLLIFVDALESVPLLTQRRSRRGG